MDTICTQFTLSSQEKLYQLFNKILAIPIYYVHAYMGHVMVKVTVIGLDLTLTRKPNPFHDIRVRNIRV
jgi:hypothetical protein